MLFDEKGPPFDRLVRQVERKTGLFLLRNPLRAQQCRNKNITK